VTCLSHQCLSDRGLAVTAFSSASARWCFTSSGVRPARSDRPGPFCLPARLAHPARPVIRAPGSPARSALSSPGFYWRFRSQFS